MKKYLLSLLLLVASAMPAVSQGLPLPVCNWGAMAYKGQTDWLCVPPANAAGAFLQTQGPGSPPLWSNQASQSFLLPTQATNTFLGNTSGSNASPTPQTVSNILDTLGYDIIRPPLYGAIVYKDIVTQHWQALQPGVIGSVLTSGGAGGVANPTWAFMPGNAIPGALGTCLVSNGVGVPPTYQACPSSGSIDIACDGNLSSATANTTAITNAIVAADGKKAVRILGTTGVCYARIFTISTNNTHLIIDSDAELIMAPVTSGTFVGNFIQVAATVDQVLIDIYGTINGNKASQTLPGDYGNGVIQIGTGGSLAAITSNVTVDGHGVGRIVECIRDCVVGLYTNLMTNNAVTFIGGSNNNGGSNIRCLACTSFIFDNNNFISPLGYAIDTNSMSVLPNTQKNLYGRIRNNYVDMRASLLTTSDSAAIETFGTQDSEGVIITDNVILGSNHASTTSFTIGISATGPLKADQIVCNNYIDGGTLSPPRIGLGIEIFGGLACNNVIKNTFLIGILVDGDDAGASTFTRATVSGNHGYRTGGSFVAVNKTVPATLGTVNIVGNSCFDCGLDVADGDIFRFENAGNFSTLTGNYVEFSTALVRDVKVIGAGFAATNINVNGLEVVNYSTTNSASISVTGSWTLNGLRMFGTVGTGTAVTWASTGGSTSLTNSNIQGYTLPWNTSAGTGKNVITNNEIAVTTPAGTTLSTDYAALNYDLNGTGISALPVTAGGTGLKVGTSGGILGFTGTTTLASSILLTQHALVIGGGAGATPTPLASLGTSTTVLHGAAAGDPTFGAIVSADLNITTTSCTNQFITAISATGVGTCTTDTLASAQHANQGTTTTLLHGNAAGNPAFGAVVTADITDANITYAKIQNVAALSLFGRSANSSGVGADITGTADQVLRVSASATSLVFGAMDLSKSAAVGTSLLSFTNGGLNAALTASNGGVFYSTASAGAILSGTATASLPLLSGATAAPTWATVSHPTSATSGGVAYFSSTTVMASSALLAANQIMLGGGAGTAPTTFACATATTVVHGGTPPTCSQVSLTADVSGITPGANGGTGNGFFAVTGPTTSLKTFTFPNASATVLTDNAAVTAAQGGTGLSTYAVGDTIYASATTPTIAKLTIGSAGTIYRSTGTLPAWSTATFPNTAAVGTVLNASSANVFGATTTPTLGASGTLGTLAFGNATSGTITLSPVAGALGSVTLTMPAATDTLVALAASQELTNKTLTSSVGKGTWTASGTWTLPAFTLGGTITGASNNINGVNIGVSSPGTGAFTTVAASSDMTVTGTAAGFVSTDGSVTTRFISSGAGSLGLIETFTNHPLVFRTFQTAALTISTSQGITFAGTFTASALTTAAGTPNSICQNNATKEIVVNAALTCTVSSAQFKHGIAPLAYADADLFKRIEPVAFIYNDDTRRRWGFIAEQVASVDPKFGDAWDAAGNPKSIDQNAILAFTVKMVQELETRIRELERKAK